MTWVAIDTVTDRIVGIGDQSTVTLAANKHSSLSGNKTLIRMLKVGMVLKQYK